MGKQKSVDVFYLDFIKTFDTVSHSILLEKLAAHAFDRCILCWIKNWLDAEAQRVVVNGVIFNWWLVFCGAPQGLMLRSALIYYLYCDLDKGSRVAQ